MAARTQDLSRHLVILEDLWQQRRGDRVLPARRDFVAEDFQPWFGHIRIVRLEGDPPRYRVTLTGTTVVQYDGRELTGTLLDEALPPAAWRRLKPFYEQAVRDRRPVYDRVMAGPAVQAFKRVERLILPCGMDGKVDTLVTAVYAVGFNAVKGTIFDAL